MKGQCNYFKQQFMQSPSFRVHSFETMFLKSNIVLFFKMFLFTWHVTVPVISCKRLVYHIYIGYYLVKWIITRLVTRHDIHRYSLLLQCRNCNINWNLLRESLRRNLVYPLTTIYCYFPSMFHMLTFFNYTHW